MAAVEEAFVVAVPGVALDGESVGGVGCAFVVAMDHLDVLELVAGVFDSRVCLRVDMRHVAPVVGVQWSLTRVEDEAIRASAIDGRRETVDLGLCWCVPAEVYSLIARA